MDTLPWAPKHEAKPMCYSPSHQFARERYLTSKDRYQATIVEHKNEYWRMKCWTEIQKKRKSRANNLKSFESLNKWHQYDRWDQKGLMKVEWEQFYEELTHEEKKHKKGAEIIEKLMTDPKYSIGAVIILFCIMFLCISLCQ
eukprot:TRINITY_DN79_c0_g1_i1.p1 TRINITY_DN79_c0_g1~~TRINITY_DN79_c0_g1_i1.p1  ORF type:complete len:142 (-),score=16.07 TRINITY_DN79_c0_g1_i1:64-489(-)